MLSGSLFEVTKTNRKSSNLMLNVIERIKSTFENICSNDNSLYNQTK
jgi:hypothetical protein